MNRYALVVGINDYADVENIQPLRFAVEDARLVDRFFHACGFEVQALMDSEATCAAIERHLRDLSGRLQPNDLFLFYFSGHGYQWGVRGEERQYLLPRDADLWAMKHGGAGRAVPMRLVQECSGNRGARRVVILDACRSGLSPGEKGDAATEERLATKDIRAMAATASPASPLIVVCSCRPGQLSYEHGGLRGGLFTNAFLSEFSRLQNAGRPVAFTSETNGAIATRMQHLAEEVHLDPGKVGTFWIEGDATALELLPARAVRPAPAPTAEAVDPEKVEVKEWVVEDLRVELERIEVAQPAASSGLPPISEAIVTLRAEIAGLEKAIAELKAGTHPSLKQAQAAVREAELQLQTFQEDLEAHEVPMPLGFRHGLIQAAATDRSLRPSEFCDIAPDIAPAILLPFVARLRNVHRAKRALDSVGEKLATATERKVADMVQQTTNFQEALQKLYEEDFRCTLRALWPSLHDADLIEVWADIEPQLMARGYGWDSRTILAKVERFLEQPDSVCCEARKLMDEGLSRQAAERVSEALGIYGEHAGLLRLQEETDSGTPFDRERVCNAEFHEVRRLLRVGALNAAAKRVQQALTTCGEHAGLESLRTTIEQRRQRNQSAWSTETPGNFIVMVTLISALLGWLVSLIAGLAYMLIGMAAGTLAGLVVGIGIVAASNRRRKAIAIPAEKLAPTHELHIDAAKALEHSSNGDSATLHQELRVIRQLMQVGAFEAAANRVKQATATHGSDAELEHLQAEIDQLRRAGLTCKEGTNIRPRRVVYIRVWIGSYIGLLVASGLAGDLEFGFGVVVWSYTISVIGALIGWAVAAINNLLNLIGATTYAVSTRRTAEFGAYIGLAVTSVLALLAAFIAPEMSSCVVTVFICMIIGGLAGGVIAAKTQMPQKGR